MNKRKKKFTANAIIVALLVCGIAWIASVFIHFGGEYTNNAQVRQNIISVSARVQGFVKEIRFEDFQKVKKGDTLLIIEDSEYRLRLAQAQADYQNAMVGKTAKKTGISTIENNVAVAEAGIREVEILFKNAEAEYDRYKILIENDAATRQQFERVQTEYESLKAKLETLKRQKQSTKLTKQEQTQRLQQDDLAVEIAKTALELAQLNLSYTVVLAPCSGTMSRKNVQEGQLVMPGSHLFAIVDGSSKWVIANYRETQRKNIKVGSKVEIKVDAYPDKVLNARVASVSEATGAQYSPSATDNSAGNFVKVENRIPVKVVFTEDNDAELLKRLAAGMNVECKVLRP